MKPKPEFRIETDLLGDVEIPSTAYWGVRTARANLPVSGLAVHSKLTDALVILKRCALDLSSVSGSKNRDVKEALLSSCNEILEGKLQSNLIADPYHCDAGNAINTNVNEVIANRAEELLGGNIGSYTRIDPDKDVDLLHIPFDMQLRNAARIGLLLGFKDLEPAILDLERWFRRKSLECEQIIRSNDTKNGVALWRSIGPELNACGTVIERCHRRLLESVTGLQEIVLANLSNVPEEKNDKQGGKEGELFDAISKASGILLREGVEKGLNCNSMSEFLQFSSALKELAVELSIVCRNLCTSCSKFNSSLNIHESKQNRESKQGNDKHTLKRMMDLIALAACQVTANDYAISQCCQVTEVPASIPFAVNALLQSLDLLRSALAHFNLQCATEITP